MQEYKNLIKNQNVKLKQQQAPEHQWQEQKKIKGGLRKKAMLTAYGWYQHPLQTKRPSDFVGKQKVAPEMTSRPNALTWQVNP
jgi:hypothetical protein